MGMSVQRNIILFDKNVAVKVGAECAMILERIAYMTEIKALGKEVDGRRWVYKSLSDWYEDFPFWSASKVKRQIKLAESTGILLSRSDLNQAGYDRTKWYSVNHEALEEMSVAPRIERIKELRKAANAARKDSAIVQDEPMVQSEQGGVQDELLGGVQDEPDNTIESNTIETDIAPNGADPEKPVKKPTPHQEMVTALCNVMCVDVDLNFGRFARFGKALIKQGYTGHDICQWYGEGGWWYKNDWRGKQGQPPNESAIRETIKTAKESVASQPVIVQSADGGLYF